MYKLDTEFDVDRKNHSNATKGEHVLTFKNVFKVDRFCSLLIFKILIHTYAVSKMFSVL